MAVPRSEEVIAVANEQETTLAWALIEAAKPHMNAGQRDFVFVTISTGDTFTAMRTLINLLAVNRISLPHQLVQRCTAWLGAYVLHEDYEHLRHRIEGFSTPDISANSCQPLMARR
jgi:hypothetical protein